MSSSISTIFGIIGAAVVIGSLFINRKTNPNTPKFEGTDGKTSFHPDELRSACKLNDPGIFIVKTVRQSGNPHQNDRIFTETESAIQSAITTFKRSRVEEVTVLSSTENLYSLRRKHFNFRGRAEGKKLGYIEIHKLSAQSDATQLVNNA